MVKNLPANAGDTGLIPGLRPRLLRPSAPEPVLQNKRSHHKKKPMR